MKFLRQIGCLVLAVVPFCIMMLAVATFIRERHSLNYTIVFKDAAHLQRGSRVLLNERAIGMVKGVWKTDGGDAEVSVRIDPPFVRRVHAGSTALVREKKYGNRFWSAVEVFNPEAGRNAPPLESGSRVEGLGSDLELQMWRVRSDARSLGESLKKALNPFAGEEETTETKGS